VLDFSAFMTVGAIHHHDWRGGPQDGDEAHLANGDILVIAADVGQPLNGLLFDAQPYAATAGFDGIGLNDANTAGTNQRNVIILAQDKNGDGNYDFADVYFVQDIDQDTGLAVAIDHVATINFATQIGAITSIDLAN